MVPRIKIRLKRVFSFSGLLAVSVLSLFGVLAYVLFSSLDLEIKAAAIVTSGTVLVSVLSLIASRNFERAKEQEQRIRQEKIQVYETFLSFYIGQLLGIPSTTDKSKGRSPSSHSRSASQDDDIRHFSLGFTPKFLLWAPDRVINLWGAMRVKFVTGPPDTEEVLNDLFNLIEAMRQDIGHSDELLNRKHLKAVFINPDPKDLTHDKPHE